MVAHLLGQVSLVVGHTRENMDDLIARALSAQRESKYIDFKGGMDFKEPHSWCETIKDIVAMANSGGGVILVGVDNKGGPTGFDPSAILGLDSAVVTDKILKYTGVQFDDFEITEERKSNASIVAIRVQGVGIPIVFTSPGTYKVGDKKQKTAFSAGTVYFRHGAKSEPGTTDDIRKVVERQLDAIRKSWVKGVRKVFQAPLGHQIVSPAPGVEVVETKSPTATPIRLTDDPTAPAYRKVDPDATHPYRQTELVNVVNKRLKGKARINSYDIQVMKRVYDISQKNEFVHFPRFSSPQYSDAFVNWMVDKFESDPEFFTKSRDEAYRRKH